MTKRYVLLPSDESNNEETHGDTSSKDTSDVTSGLLRTQPGSTRVPSTKTSYTTEGGDVFPLDGGVTRFSGKVGETRLISTTRRTPDTVTESETLPNDLTIFVDPVADPTLTDEGLGVSLTTHTLTLVSSPSVWLRI